MHNTNSIFSFYYDLLFFNGLKDIQKEFLDNQDLKKNHYYYVKKSNYYEKDIDLDNSIVDIIDRDRFFTINLEKTDGEIYNNIKEKLAYLKNISDQKLYLSNIFDDLKILLEKVNSSNNEKQHKIIEGNLLEILGNLKHIYKNIIKKHSCFIYLNKSKYSSFFQCKDIKRSFFGKLYDVTLDLDLIDDIEIKEVDFINAFTASKPQILKDKIKFDRETPIIVYYFLAIEPFFFNLNAKSIESSQVFITKQDNILTVSNFGVSKKRTSKKIENFKLKIDEKIEELKLEYLK